MTQKDGSFGDALAVAGVSFARNVIGLIIRPYETCRRIAERSSLGELIFIALLLALYFATASFVRAPSFRVFFLTRHFATLALATGGTFIVVVALFWLIGSFVGATGRPRGFLLAWAYTLVPTLLWFLVTSLLYVIIPPPRTARPLGIFFSVLYVSFSATLLFWKVTLGYLAIRFGMRLSLGKILIVTGIVLPILGLYSIGMYRMGIFRVPFF